MPARHTRFAVLCAPHCPPRASPARHQPAAAVLGGSARSASFAVHCVVPLAAVPIAYDPTDYRRVLFARAGSALPEAVPRSLFVLPLAVGAQLCYHYDVYTEDITPVLLPISVLVGLLTSFRITDAFGKWNRASRNVLQMHQVIRETMSKLLAFVRPPTEGDAELEPRLEEIRRLLVLAAVMIKKHVRSDSKFDDELKRGLVTDHEVEWCTPPTERAPPAEWPVGPRMRRRSAQCAGR